MSHDDGGGGILSILRTPPRRRPAGTPSDAERQSRSSRRREGRREGGGTSRAVAPPAAPTAVGVGFVVAGLLCLSFLVDNMTRADSTLGPATLELFQRLDAALERNGTLGVVYFLLTYVVATLLLAPASALVILSGALYGPPLGAAAAIVATLVGSGAAYLLARYAARPYVSRALTNYPRFAAVDRAVASEGGRMVLLMRLSPFIPFNVANYIFGLTAVELGPYLGFTLLGMLPYTFVFVYMGAAMRATFAATVGGGETGDLAEAPAWQSPAKISLYIMGVAATAMITLKVRCAGCGGVLAGLRVRPAPVYAPCSRAC